jgi:hypothetical protein
MSLSIALIWIQRAVTASLTMSFISYRP